VQWVLGHAHLSATQQYLTPLPGEVIESMLAFHQRHRGPAGPPSADYRAGSLRVLFGEDAL